MPNKLAALLVLFIYSGWIFGLFTKNIPPETAYPTAIVLKIISKL